MNVKIISMQLVVDVFDILIPARSAGKALVLLAARWASKTSLGNTRSRQTKRLGQGRRLAFNHVSRQANSEIARETAMFLQERGNKRILSSRKPKRDARQVLAYLNNHFQMLN